MGWPGRLAGVARPGAGCAMRDSDKWDALARGGGVGRPGRLTGIARPGAGCALRDSDKWDALPEGGHGPAGQAGRGRAARCGMRDA
jgi:hypothetical protein